MSGRKVFALPAEVPLSGSTLMTLALDSAAGPQLFFMSCLLHDERNFLRSLPCRPFASACLEHSIDSAVRGFADTVVLGSVVAFGVILPATGGLAVGAGVVVCANAMLAERALTAIPTSSKLRMALPFHCISAYPHVSGIAPNA
jgi:hypothetical protein